MPYSFVLNRSLNYMVLLNQRQHGTEMKITINLAIFIFERVAGQSCELMGQSAWSVLYLFVFSIDPRWQTVTGQYVTHWNYFLFVR